MASGGRAVALCADLADEAAVAPLVAHDSAMRAVSGRACRV